MNWDKSYILMLGRIERITIPYVQIVSADHLYSHLGIPVGTDIQVQVQSFWEKIVHEFRDVADQRLKFHLSIRGRVSGKSPRRCLLVKNLPE